MDKIIYFELNNWIPGIFYPDDEPFRLWIKNDLQIKFDDETWVKKSRLCVVRKLIDMSSNYCITATREWVVNNCPKLLTDYAEFIRYKEDDGKVYGRFGTEFKEYREENIGIWDLEENYER